MSARLALLLSVSLFAAHSAAPAQRAAEAARAPSIPLFGRVLSFRLPVGLVLANNKRNGTHVLMEFVPANQSLATWTRMVTVQAYRGLGASPESTASIARRAFYPAACKIGPGYSYSGEHMVADGLNRSVLSVACASLPAGAYPLAMKGAGEQDFNLIYRDADTVYTLNYAERGAPFAGKAPPHPPENAEAILGHILGSVTLCRTTEACGKR